LPALFDACAAIDQITSPASSTPMNFTNIRSP
jgi:hypothetical protein